SRLVGVKVLGHAARRFIAQEPREPYLTPQLFCSEALPRQRPTDKQHLARQGLVLVLANLPALIKQLRGQRRRCGDDCFILSQQADPDRRSQTPESDFQSLVKRPGFCPDMVQRAWFALAPGTG